MPTHTPKAQTTRHSLLGIVTQPDAQYLFLDTPGLQIQHKSALHRAMSRSVTGALEQADVILWVLDGLTLDATEEKLKKLLPPATATVVVCTLAGQWLLRTPSLRQAAP